MFVQVITAKVVDTEGLWRLVDRWEEEIRPGAAGFLGSTSGVTDDGRLIVLARFESEDAAEANGARPEQGAWWAETEKLLDQVEFRNSTDVVPMWGGVPASAGFVQVMRGRVVDPAKLRDLQARTAEFEAAMASHRPDVVGDLTAVHDDGTYTDAVFFTSEAEARRHEAQELPAELQGMFEEWMSAATVDEYYDLTRPRLA